jgi:hypothetical protein
MPFTENVLGEPCPYSYSGGWMRRMCAFRKI